MNTHTLLGFAKKTFKMAALSTVLIAGIQTKSHAQQDEKFGHTLNLGLGFAYFSYVDNSTPYFTANYEFDVARNFTLAPFIGIASYRSGDDYRFGGNSYYYRETIIPVGVKGTYYFDDLLDLNPRWDIYAAASLGFTFSKVSWQDGYNGDRGVSRDASPLYLDGHIGAEYHFNNRLGLYLDLSTGVSTIGLSVHGRTNHHHHPVNKEG